MVPVSPRFCNTSWGHGMLKFEMNFKIDEFNNWMVLAKKSGSELMLSNDEGEWIDICQGHNWDQASQQKLIDLVTSHFPPFSQSNKTLPKLFLKSPINDQAIFFGGSFNPWHMGHRVSLDLCPGRPIVIVPDQNPWKNVQKRIRVWDYYLELANKLKNTDYSIYPGFLNLDRPNPTYDWLSALPLKKKSLLMGEDSFVQLLKWKDAQKLVQMLDTIYVSPRAVDHSKIVETENELKKISHRLKIVYLDHHDYEEISSTKIRSEN